jgi:hypothetical protein
MQGDVSTTTTLPTTTTIPTTAAISAATPSPKICPGCTNSTCWDNVTEFQTCTSFSGSREFLLSSATALTSSLLTYTGGYLEIRGNPFLTNIILPSLSTVVGALEIRHNPSLTFASLPKLTYIDDNILICANNAAFRIPAGPPDAPTGGLTSATRKGQVLCWLQEGAGTCSTVTCP